MSKFKEGDKVKVISCEKPTYWYANKIGQEFTLKKLSSFGWNVEDDYYSHLKECDIEIVQEKEQMKSEAFNLKKNPWYITFKNEEEFNLIRDWLKSNGIAPKYSEEYDANAECFSQSWVTSGKYIRDSIVCAKGSGAKEIKFTFKTQKVIDSITFPELKSEQQLKIEELQATIEKAQQQIEQLKEIK